MHCRRPVQPIVTRPRYVVRDFVTPRPVPIIHPIVHVNRQNIVNVPQHFYQRYTKNVVVDRGWGFGPNRRFW